MELLTFYQVLGVEETATGEEIKKAYRQMARKHHTDLPDSTSGDKVFMVTLNKARDVLLDPDKRRTYDEQLRRARSPRPAKAPTPPPTRPPTPQAAVRAAVPVNPGPGAVEVGVGLLAAWGTFKILESLFGGGRRT